MITAQQRERIARAIAEAEEGNTGRIAVRVIPDKSVDAFQRAVHEFERHDLHAHEHNNAALVLVAPNARAYAVIGDRALHERVGDAFWSEVVDRMRPHFMRGDLGEAIVCAVEQLGEALHGHFKAAAR